MIEKKYIHLFEEAGLGIAPFKVKEVVFSGWDSCDYCGTGIKEHCYIQDSRGKVFLVGNECVYKTGDAGIVDTVRREVNRLKTEARHRKQDEKIALGKAFLEGSLTIREKLKAELHPYPYRAEKGETLFDWVESMFEFAGRKGKCEASDVILKLAENFLSSDVYSSVRQNYREVSDYYDYRKQKEKADVLMREKERQIQNAKAYTQENEDIILIMSEMNPSPFVTSMLRLLEIQSLSDFSNGQFNAMADIYAKSFGRRGSKEYTEALEDFNKRK